MNCQEVNELFGAYLDGEVTSSEWMLIQSHLAGCDVCREKLAALSVTHSRVSRSLRVRAAWAAPSPRAWSRLQARLDGEARPSRSWFAAWLQRLALGGGGVGRFLERGMTMKKALAFAAIAIAIGSVALVPSVRAQLGKIIADPARFRFLFWTRSGTVSRTATVTLSAPEEFTEFTPFHPTYLPVGLSSWPSFRTHTSDEPEPEFLEMTYNSVNQFLIITQSKATADRALPAGRDVTVTGQPAVLVTGLEGTFTGDRNNSRIWIYYGGDAQEETSGKLYGGTLYLSGQPSIGHRVSIDYTDGKRLTWYTDDVKVVMLSNLSEKEMLKIAESLEPAEQEGRDLRWRLPLPRLSVEIVPIESDP